MPKPQEKYENLLKNGGELTFVVTAGELKFTADIETCPSIEPLLYSGFEIKPSIIIEENSAAGQIYAHGDDWTRAITYIYRSNGTIIYKKQVDGMYEVTMRLPVSKT